MGRDGCVWQDRGGGNVSGMEILGCKVAGCGIEDWAGVNASLSNCVAAKSGGTVGSNITVDGGTHARARGEGCEG